MVSAGLLIGFSFSATGCAPAAVTPAGPPVRAQRLAAHRHGRQHHGARRPLRDGAGGGDRAPDARGRGARGRLDQDRHRVRTGRPTVYFNPDFGIAGHRRQQQRARRLHAAAPGGRRGARDAHRGGRRPVEGGPLRVPRRAGRRDPHGEQPAADLRRAGGSGREAAGADRTCRSRTPRIRSSSARRPGGSTRRPRWTGARCSASTSGCRACWSPWWRGRPVFGGKVGELRRHEGQGGAGRARRGADLERGGGGGRRLLAGAPGARRRWR